MKIAIVGSAGQLGTDLVRHFANDRQVELQPLTHANIELTNPASIEQAFSNGKPDRIINTAAYNLVDKAEDEPDRAFAINAFATRNLAQWCGRHDVPLLHVSTDYVFQGHVDQTVAWVEEDLPAPASVYGASKLAGEHFVAAYCPKHFIVRTCGLYGLTAARGKGNFIETMLRLGAERPELRVVNDQFCTPTSTVDLAVAIEDLVRTTKWGTYHATNSGQTSWYELACEVFRQADFPAKPVVSPVPASSYGAKAQRPAFSVLDCSKLIAVTGKPLPHWKVALGRYLKAR
jgi:dTDP-4-dehydrorhamnose reductase